MSEATKSVSDVLSVLRGEMSKLRIPSTHDKVYKDECMYSFDSPYSDRGLYVNLVTYGGVGRDYLALDAKKTGGKLYLHEQWQQVKVSEDSGNNTAEGVSTGTSQPQKLAIGVTGGFNVDKPHYETVKEHTLVVLNNNHTIDAIIPLPNRELPEFISNVLQAIIDHVGMKKNMEVSTWDADQEKIISKYAENLQQINPSGKKISQNPKDWKDEASDATDNLWLNLSTGYIGGGRKNWDGSGGSGSALQHYLDTGKQYPLVVKLGTITQHGADVWSYASDEDCLVIDPHLADHLSFWGIDIMKLEKTDQSMGEMEVALNMNYDWSKLMEGQEELIPLHGAGYVGLRNIGSTCYMNSLLQPLFHIPEMQDRYLVVRDQILQACAADPTNDFMVQLSKVAHALLTESYVPPVAVSEVEEKKVSASLGEMGGDVNTLEKYIIAPRMFKQLVGKNHPEFSTSRQQDVYDFYCHLLSVMQKAEHGQLAKVLGHSGAPGTTSIFEYHNEVKFKVLDSNEVKFAKRGPSTLENILSLRIPMDKAEKIPAIENDHDDEDPHQESKRQRVPEEEKLRIPFEACLQHLSQPELVTLRHPSTNQPTSFLKTTRFATFPRYLVLRLERYYVGENWTPKKISAEIPVPEKLDLSHLRGQGLQSDEVELADGESGSGSASAAAAAGPFVIDENLVEQLVCMGFSENGCRRAAIATKNADVETAMNWILEHMEDADFNSPPVMPSNDTGSSAAPQIDEEKLMMLTCMGFTVEQATAALMTADMNTERAADWLFSHVDTLDADVAEILNKPAASGGQAASGLAVDDGEGKYTLMSVISHMGKNIDHGHYICHVRKNGQWTLFNDEKVGKSDKPPLGYGYMYIFRRDDGPGTMF